METILMNSTASLYSSEVSQSFAKKLMRGSGYSVINDNSPLVDGVSARRQLEFYENQQTCAVAADCMTGCCVSGVCQSSQGCLPMRTESWVIITVVVIAFGLSLLIYCIHRRKLRRAIASRAQDVSMQSSSQIQMNQSHVLNISALNCTANNNIQQEGIYVQNLDMSSVCPEIYASADLHGPKVANEGALNNNFIIAEILVNNSPRIEREFNARNHNDEHEENADQDLPPIALPQSMYFTPEDAERHICIGRPADENAKLPEGIEVEEPYLDVKELPLGRDEGYLPGQLNDGAMGSVDLSKLPYGNQPEESSAENTVSNAVENETHKAHPKTNEPKQANDSDAIPCGKVVNNVSENLCTKATPTDDESGSQENENSYEQEIHIF